MEVAIKYVNIGIYGLEIPTDQDPLEALRGISIADIHRFSGHILEYDILVRSDGKLIIDQEVLEERVFMEELRSSKIFHLTFEGDIYPSAQIIPLLDGAYEMVDFLTQMKDQRKRKIIENANDFLRYVNLGALEIMDKHQRQAHIRQKVKTRWFDRS